MRPREFLDGLQALIQGFRQKIELEVSAFPVDAKARATRVARVMAPDGYRYFVETYLPHYLGKDPSLLHQELYRDLPQMIAAPEGQKRLVIAPRGSAKSTHISLAFPLWCIITGRKHYITLIMDAFEQAAVMVEALKAELEVNPRLSYDFPKVVGQGRLWREGVIITANNVKVEAFGTGKKIRGRRHGPWRPDLAILDDVENDENVESPRQRDKLESWIAKAVLKLGPTDGTMDVLYAGTVLHFDAVILRFAKKPGWQVARYQAILHWPDRMDLWDKWEELYLNNEDEADAFWVAHQADLEQGAVLNWPAMHSLLFLMKERAGDHDSFESEYQNAPLNGSNAFKNITFWALKKRDWLYFGGIDPSLGKAGKGRDPSAILIGGYDRLEGVFDVVEASIRKRLPSVIIAEAIAMQREYNCLLWFVESVQFQEFLRTEMMTAAARVGVAMPCIPIIPIADKALRIERLQPPISAGLIRLHSSQRTLIDQLQQYPSAAHDDGPDCLEMLWNNALHYGGGGVTGGQIMTEKQDIGAGHALGGLGDYRL
ncbi:MAG: phage terminase large subunit [Paracoccus sp. (in: a-proteobacteria)]|uniref:phage terminase large subunit n=1 Tax=Paracoccus sp. TaxID=267 RepID=UPI0026E0D8A9|nr:phage terminase large subunit [Paracoccus sp. (in: a-proteobacteria)]MDO5614439.1 phage terminase large subunit [Paracoccus sp. (in: a-proteobacteria)]